MSDLVGNPEDRFSHNGAHSMLWAEKETNNPNFNLKIGIYTTMLIAGIDTSLFIGCFVETRNYSILSLASIADSFRVTGIT